MMRVSTMRRVDRWIGVPLCACLTALDRVVRLLHLGSSARRPVHRILFVKLAEQGATVLAYPAIQEAVERVGRENVFVIVFTENRFILDVMDIVPKENVIAVRTGGLVATAWNVLCALAQLRRIRVDATVDFEFFARSSAIIAYLSGAAVRIGLGPDRRAPYRGHLLTHRLAHNPDLHVSELYGSLVELLDEPPGDFGKPTASEIVDRYRPPEFQPRDDERSEMVELLDSLAGRAVFGDGQTSSPMKPKLVLLNPNASDLLPVRCWPPDRYVALARRLLAADDTLWVAMTGAPGEREVTERLVAAVDSRRCLSLAGRTTLRQLLVAYCLADILVTNDSGPAHFAGLTPITVVALFGPETPAVFGGRSPRSHILWKGLPCSPCVSAYNHRDTPCRDNRCMREITVEEVFEVVMSTLVDRPGGTTPRNETLAGHDSKLLSKERTTSVPEEKSS